LEGRVNALAWVKIEKNKKGNINFLTNKGGKDEKKAL